jgi:hypothetical protein
MTKDWTALATDKSINKVADSLKSENVEVIVAESGADAKEKILELVPKGAEVMTMASQTLEAIGINKEINESGNYNSVKARLMKMDRATQGLEMQKLGATPEWTLGSVHAVSEDGHVFVASNTGSQLGAYAFTSQHIIWVIGSQKIVKDWDEGIKRVYEYTLPKESERQKGLGNPKGSNIGKLLIFNNEFRPGRITMIIVKEVLGF